MLPEREQMLSKATAELDALLERQVNLEYTNRSLVEQLVEAI
jgi:hypothetical protein